MRITLRSALLAATQATLAVLCAVTAATAADNRLLPPTGRAPGRLEPPRPVPLPHRTINVTAEGIFHFPLQLGNQWLFERRYPSGAQDTWQLTVGEVADTSLDGLTLRGWYGGDHVVGYGADGEITERLPGGASLLWYRLGTNVGTRWTMNVAGGGMACIDGSEAVVTSHSETLSVPAGQFVNVLRVDYRALCADAGPVAEWFAAGVGLVRREERSLEGPVISELLAAHVAETTLPDHPTGTSLTLDALDVVAAPEGPAPQAGGTFRVHDQTSDTMSFAFVGCVSARLTLVDAAGAPVLEARIDDGGCCECPDVVTLGLHGATLSLPFRIPLVSEHGMQLAPGHYSLVATLEALESPLVRPSATAHFHLRASR